MIHSFIGGPMLLVLLKLHKLQKVLKTGHGVKIEH